MREVTAPGPGQARQGEQHAPQEPSPLLGFPESRAVLSHELVIQNHTDAASCLVVTVLLGLTFEDLAKYAIIFIAVQYNVTYTTGEILLYLPDGLLASCTARVTLPEDLKGRYSKAAMLYLPLHCSYLWCLYVKSQGGKYTTSPASSSS